MVLEKWIIVITILALLLLYTVSCTSTILGPDLKNTYSNNLNSLWETIDRYYPFFEYKQIDWDSIHSVYNEKLKNITTEKDFFNLLGSMCKELRDGHVSINSPNGWKSRFLNSDSYPLNSPLNISNYVSELDSSLWPYVYGNLLELPNSIYIRILTFNGVNNSKDERSHKQIDKILQKNPVIESIILDVRDNDGGMSNNADVVASRFISKKALWGYVRNRNGPKRNDFTKWRPQYLNPISKGYSIPICILTNRKCFSSCETFIMRMKVLPNVTIIGSNTGGGTSIPIMQELMNGWSYRLSAVATVHPDYSLTEETGIPPDIQVDVSEQESIGGKDIILERAIKYLHLGK